MYILWNWSLWWWPSAQMLLALHARFIAFQHKQHVVYDGVLLRARRSRCIGNCPEASVNTHICIYVCWPADEVKMNKQTIIVCVRAFAVIHTRIYGIEYNLCG